MDLLVNTDACDNAAAMTVTATVSLSVPILGFSTLLKLVQYVPIPRHRHQLDAHVYDSFVRFCVCTAAADAKCSRKNMLMDVENLEFSFGSTRQEEKTTATRYYCDAETVGRRRSVATE